MSGTLPDRQNLVTLPLRGWLHIHETVDPVSIFYTRYVLSCSSVKTAPFDRFSRLIAQKTCFRVLRSLLGTNIKF